MKQWTRNIAFLGFTSILVFLSVGPRINPAFCEVVEQQGIVHWVEVFCGTLGILYCYFENITNDDKDK